MNPFDLRGPEFLLFYAILSFLVLAVVYGQRRPASDLEGIPSRIDDAYLLAVVRSGTAEALKVAVLSLVDRWLLKAKEGRLQALAGPELVRRPLEKALLALYQSEGAAGAASQDARVREAVEAIDEEATRAGLLTEKRIRGRVSPAGFLGAALLLAVAGTKIVVALSRGRTNILILLGLGLVLPVVALVVGTRPRRTRKGDKLLELARRSFARLKTDSASIVPGGETNELALAVAVFGVGVLPPLARELMIEAGQWQASSSGGSSFGSSCSSSSSCGSSSSSCGSSCGGGGGCGGCGS